MITIVLENHSYADVVGSSPYLNRLAGECGLAANYFAVAHPSLPNYLALTSGSADGISSDCTDCAIDVPSIFEQVGGDWRAYVESLPRPGFRGAFSGRYAKKHNPAAYYTRIQAAYTTRAVPLPSLARDLARDRLPRYAFVTPNLCNDEHDCPIATGDAWLARWVPRILGSRAYRRGRTALFLTYDEGTGSDNRVYTVVVAPSVRPGTVVKQPFAHYSLLRTEESLVGVPCLALACRAVSMRAAFGL